MRGDDELALAAHAHRADAFVPALDDAAAPEGKHDRLAAVVRRVELLAALEPAGVVHAHRVAGLGARAGALDELDVAESGGRFDDLLIHGSIPLALSRTTGSYRRTRSDQVRSGYAASCRVSRPDAREEETMTLVTTALAVLLLLTGLAGPALAQTLHVYTAWPESLSQPIFKAYTAKTGVTINFIRLSTGELGRARRRRRTTRGPT